MPAGERVPELVEQDDTEKRQVFVASPNLRAVNAGALGQFVGKEEEPGEMQVNLDAAKFEKTNRAAHGGQATAEPRERPTFYKVVGAGVSGETRRRIGSMCDS